MTGAMYAAVSGLKAHMSAMNVIGNNISNVNTTAYKNARYTFNEALYTTVRSGSNGGENDTGSGGLNPAQVGYGCNIGTIDIDMSTKNYSPTGQALDCMIDGDGFFVVGDEKSNKGITTTTQLQGMSLSRLGNFEFKDGYLVDGNGSIVYGFLRTDSLDSDSTKTSNDITSKILTPIRLPNCVISEKTSGGTVTTILWPSENEGGTAVEDTTSADGVELPTTIVEGSTTSAQRLQGTSISIDATGCITCMTKDEQLIVVGYVAIAQVDSPNGVTHVDGRYFKALGGAGDIHLATVGGAVTYVPSSATAGSGGSSTTGSQIAIEAAGDTELVTGGLESSGTDLATEISNMIVIQRGYQANTRIVTVTDSMLEELVNMKR